MPESQRKARDTPCSCFCDGLRQLLSCLPVVAPSQVSASTRTLSQGIGWQPFRDSERDKNHLQLQHCQQKPSRSQDMVQQGSLLPRRRKPVGAVGLHFRLQLALPAHCSPSWRPETVSLMTCCPAYSSLSMRRWDRDFASLHRVKTQLTALMMSNKNPAACPLWHALVSAGVKKPECQPNTGVPSQVSVFLLRLSFTQSLCRFLNHWGLLKRLQFQNGLLLFDVYPNYLIYHSCLSCKIGMMWDTERVR